jgi:HSP20 family protein
MHWNTFNTTWSPWQELHRIQSDLGNLFQGASGRERASDEYPRINVLSGENELKLQAQLPGLAPEDIEINVVGDTVTLKGARSDVAGESDEVHRRERRTGKFVRSFQLPFEIEAGEVVARFKNGVLTIDLPRAHAQRPRSIAVQTA